MSTAEDDQRTPQATSDGSMTLHSERFGQTYHSRHGALTESLHVFLDAGWSERLSSLESGAPLRVLELGLGTGLNALLTRKAHAERPPADRPSLVYEALEPHPDAGRMGRHGAAHLVRRGGRRPARSPRSRTTRGGVERRRALRPAPHDVAAVRPGPVAPRTFDLIYFDAAPDEPELWLPERFVEPSSFSPRAGCS